MKSTRERGLGLSLVSSGIGPLLSQVFALALVPVLFRLYTPQDFGIWAAIQAGAIIAGSLVSLRFDLALVLERDLVAASQLLFAIIAVVLASSLVMAVAIVVSSSFLYVLGIDAISAALGWGWLVLLGLSTVFQSWLMRAGAFGSVSVALVLSAGVTNLVQLGGGMFGYGIWLIVGSIAGQAAALMFSIWKVTHGADHPVWRALNFEAMWMMLRKNKRFPQFSLPFTALSLLRERAPIFIIGAFGPPALVGLYSQAWRLTHFPSGLTSAALRPVFFHRTATEGLTSQGRSVDGLVRCLLLASSSWIAFVIYGDDALFNFLLGTQWQGVGLLAASLVMPAALFTITNWMDRLLDAVGRQDVNLKLEMITGISSVGALWGTLAAGGSLFRAVLVQSAALVLGYLGFLWVCYGIANWPRSGLIKSLCAAVAMGGSMYAFLIALGNLLFSQTEVFVAGFVTAGFANIVVLLFAWKELR
ncbi:O-antigen/teichoic acid export membrane protein [Nitrobacter vulgaris]|uniref:oligosaccharide flippase family protein n=1 Tax=Nitrobacter vulgaris TaxID=29421 RepID=UPI002858C627|nr:oligosaccharide flippase family protein [Nitrobacter vulgaris]MDR6304582.1 O-antigen/teichoic acid export membrane protein [Nitrobacter vulgaris]